MIALIRRAQTKGRGFRSKLLKLQSDITIPIIGVGTRNGGGGGGGGGAEGAVAPPIFIRGGLSPTLPKALLSIIIASISCWYLASYNRSFTTPQNCCHWCSSSGPLSYDRVEETPSRKKRNALYALYMCARHLLRSEPRLLKLSYIATVQLKKSMTTLCSRSSYTCQNCTTSDLKRPEISNFPGGYAPRPP